MQILYAHICRHAVITYETYADAILSIRRPTMKYATWAQPGLLAKPIDRDFGDLPSDMFTFASISDIFADFSVLSLSFLLFLSFFLFYVVLRDFLCQDPTRVYRRRDIHTIGSLCSRTSFVNDRQRDKHARQTQCDRRKRQSSTDRGEPKLPKYGRWRLVR